MKRIITVVLVLIFVMGLSTNVFAAGSNIVKKTHNVEVNVTSDITVVDEGGTVNLKALTSKYGSALYETLTGWSGDGVAAAITSLNAEGYYESNTVFTAPYVNEDTDITITYAIAATAGKSGVVFAGQDSTVITVNDVSVVVTLTKIKIRVIAKATTGNAADSDGSKNTQLTFAGVYELSNGQVGAIEEFNVVIPAKDADGIKTAEVTIQDNVSGVNETVEFGVSKTLVPGDELNWSNE